MKTLLNKEIETNEILQKNFIHLQNKYEKLVLVL